MFFVFSVQSPAQRLQSFVTSSLPTMHSRNRLRHPIQNQALLTSGPDSAAPQMQEKQAYSSQEMLPSPNKRLYLHANGSNNVSNRMNSSRSDSTHKDRMYEENTANTTDMNRVERNTGRVYFSNNAAYPDASKNDSDRDYYHSRSYSQGNNCCHSLPLSYHQNSHVSALGNYVQMQQDAAELSFRHSRAQPRTFPATFLPFACYGSSSEYDSQTSDNLNPDNDTPLDYSKSSYSKHGLNGYFGKSDLEKRPTNYFVSPGFARLTHL